MIRRRTEESGRYSIILFESIYATSDPKSGSWLGLRWVTWDGTTGDYGSGGVESNGRFELPAVQALAGERRRFGYRCLWVLLRREGHAVNRKRLYRLFRQERLMVRRHGGRKRAVGVRSPLPLPVARTGAGHSTSCTTR
jgi:hypothetical protein